MKYILLSVTLLGFVFSISIISCNKNTAETSYDVSHLNEYFAGLKSTPQKFTVQAGRDTVVYGASGTVFHFYTNSFKDGVTGAILASGTISLELIEMYKPGEMIANRSPTTEDNMPLQSSGEVSIAASCNGKTVVANVYGIAFKKVGPDAQQMQLYYQGAINKDSSINWKKSDTSKPGRTATASDSLTIRTYNGGSVKLYDFYYLHYLFDSCTSFGTVNCDRSPADLWGVDVKLTTVHVNLGDLAFNGSNTQVYFAYPSDNIVVGLYCYQNGKTTFGSPELKPMFPIGRPYKVVVLSFKNNRYYYMEQSGTITENMEIGIMPVEETLGNIRTRMAAM